MKKDKKNAQNTVYKSKTTLLSVTGAKYQLPKCEHLYNVEGKIVR